MQLEFSFSFFALWIKWVTVQAFIDRPHHFRCLKSEVRFSRVLIRRGDGPDFSSLIWKGDREERASKERMLSRDGESMWNLWMLEQCRQLESGMKSNPGAQIRPFQRTATWAPRTDTCIPNVKSWVSHRRRSVELSESIGPYLQHTAGAYLTAQDDNPDAWIHHLSLLWLCWRGIAEGLIRCNEFTHA